MNLAELAKAANEDVALRRETTGILLKLGITPNYLGFCYCVDAVCLASADSQKLLATTKLLYPEVAILHQTEMRSVERNIRTAVRAAWAANPAAFQEQLGCNFPRRPSVGSFLSVLCLRMEGFSREVS